MHENMTNHTPIGQKHVFIIIYGIVTGDTGECRTTI